MKRNSSQDSDVETRYCLWCCTPYEALHPDQRYCKKLHSKKAQQARARRGLKNGECPTPDKKAFDTCHEGEMRLTSMRRSDLEVYGCHCGKFHIGHVPAWLRSTV